MYLTFLIRAYNLLVMFGTEGLEEALRSLGAVLEARRLSYRLLVAGGSSLLLLGFVDRATADLDVVGIAERGGGGYRRGEPLPVPLVLAVADVGRALGLDPRWLNAGPASLVDFGLPAGLGERVTVRRYGALELHLPGRFDLICFKLYAAVDQGPRSKHQRDLEALEPSAAELVSAARWARTHDPSPGFRTMLVGALRAFGVEVGDGTL
jgi:hypothetical protein